MNRSVRGLIVVAATSVLAALPTSGATVWAASPSVLFSFTLDADPAYCAFPVDISFVGEPQSIREVGRGVIFTGGGEYSLLANDNTEKTIRVTGAGSYVFTTAPDGSPVSIDIRGAVLIFGQQRFGLPGVAVNIGQLNGVYGSDGRIASETLSGELIDVCSALGGR